MNLTDLIFSQGVPNPSGTATMHGIADVNDITTLQTPVDKITDVGATPATVATITTAHVFATGKAMSRLYATQNKNKGGYTPVGETDSEGMKATAELFHPGSKAQADALALLYNAFQGIFFLQETDGTVRQIGNAQFPARFKVTYDTGNNESYRGIKIEVMAYGLPYIYTPGLNFTPAT